VRPEQPHSLPGTSEADLSATDVANELVLMQAVCRRAHEESEKLGRDLEDLVNRLQARLAEHPQDTAVEKLSRLPRAD
jgi:hypothetical protein